MVELVRAGRHPEDLSREFKPSAQAIRNWVRQAERDNGCRPDGLTTGEWEEMVRLRREVRQLRQERDILEGGGLVRARDRHDPVRTFRFRSANRAVLPIAAMARVLGVSEAGYHA